MNESELQPGDLFADTYEIVERLGSGEFTQVYVARQRGLDRRVALKILQLDAPGERVDSVDGHRWVERFEQEARIVSKLKDPHTVTIHDYGLGDPDLWYIAFEYVDGQNLEQVIHREGRLSVERVIRVMRQVLASLREAHDQGVLHRDLKPGNIMLFEHMDDADRAMLLDFGIAKPTEVDGEESSADITRETVILGTPRYMPREQIRKEELSPATDLYALGLVMWEMLTGRPVVDDDDTVAMLSRQVDPEPFTMSSNEGVPEPFCRIVRRLVEKQPEERYQLCEEVIEALDAYQDPARDIGPRGEPIPKTREPERSESTDGAGEQRGGDTIPEIPVAFEADADADGSDANADADAVEDEPDNRFELDEQSDGPGVREAERMLDTPEDVLRESSSTLQGRAPDRKTVIGLVFVALIGFGVALAGSDRIPRMLGLGEVDRLFDSYVTHYFSGRETEGMPNFQGKSFSVDGILEAVTTEGWEPVNQKGFVEADGAKSYVQNFHRDDAKLSVRIELLDSDELAFNRVKSIGGRQRGVQFGRKVVVVEARNDEAADKLDGVVEQLQQYRKMILEEP